MNVGGLIPDDAGTQPAVGAFGTDLPMDYREMWATACQLSKGLRTRRGAGAR
jgi:hypothetical protein